mmetsp:Transcript_67702/g.198820  ORF Transcript_67702/g.198820 Transcript_67702/m.198820 type:complete len:203 (+) Transcript_67702:1-609(+)
MYRCSDYRPFDVMLPYARLSWMFSPYHGGPQVSSRPRNHVLTELGLRNVSEGHGPCPDLLVIQSGLWDTREPWEASEVAGSAVDVLVLLQSVCPSSHIIWLGSLQVEPLANTRTWLTASRIAQQSKLLDAALAPLRVPFVDARSMYSAVRTKDGYHFAAQLYLDWANIILNEWVRTGLADAHKQRQWSSSALSQCRTSCTSP